MERHNIITDTDSYKLSHWLQYPPGTERVYSYVAARGRSNDFRFNRNTKSYDRLMLFGLQDLIVRKLSVPVTMEDVEEARSYFDGHGVPWNEAGWLRLLEKHGGRLPICIKAVPEGTIVPLGIPLVTVMNTDPEFYWLTSYLETAILRACWYGSTVAMNSWHIKQDILEFWKATSDAPIETIDFKLHDFGCRGVSSRESAAIGGAAHLVNFMGTDTLPALKLLRESYFHDGPAGFSIPAAEHSTTTSWGRENELAAYEHMLDTFGKPGALVAVVSDSYDIFNAVKGLWGGVLRDKVRASGATVVIRPDSGDPTSVVLKVVSDLMLKFGFTVNSKGFKVLPDCVRVIQGDGINRHTINSILEALKVNSISVDNVAFGMGGALLQEVSRDTYGFAMKASAIESEGRWRAIFKDPVTAKTKASLKGLVEAATDEYGNVVVCQMPSMGGIDRDKRSIMKTVFLNGDVMNTLTLAEVRENARRSSQ